MSIQNSLNAPLPLAVSQGGTGNNTALTNGQLWVGNTGNNPTISTLTKANNNIQIVTSAGGIAIGAAPQWQKVTDVGTQLLAPGIGYQIGVLGVQFKLPLSPQYGDTYWAAGSNFASGGFTVLANTSQTIILNNTPYTTSVSCTVEYGAISLYCLDSVAGIFNVLTTNATFTGT